MNHTQNKTQKNTMTNLLTNLPNDILDVIYKQKHKLELKEIHKELLFNYSITSIYDKLLNDHDPFLLLPCNWNLQDMKIEGYNGETYEILNELEQHKLKSWTRVFTFGSGVHTIDELYFIQNNLTTYL